MALSLIAEDVTKLEQALENALIARARTIDDADKMANATDVAGIRIALAIEKSAFKLGR